MASEDFPVELYNCADFTVVRRAQSSDFGDNTGSPTAIAGPLQAIVVPSTRLVRLADGEERRVFAEVYLPATASGAAAIKEGDRCSWSLAMPASSAAGEYVVAVEDYQLAGLESVRLLVGGGAR